MPQTRQSHCLQLGLLYLLSQANFGTFTVKFIPHLITSLNIAFFQNTVKRL